MKSSLFFSPLLAALVAALFCVVASANWDVDADFSLGSEIGDNISGDEIMPFWAQVETGYEFSSDSGSFKPYLVPIGHTSSADVNQGVEFQGEYYGAGLEAIFGQFNIGAQLVKYRESNLERETANVQMYEVGLNTALAGVPFRVTAFYENAKSGYLERMGLKFGYTFDLW